MRTSALAVVALALLGGAGCWFMTGVAPPPRAPHASILPGQAIPLNLYALFEIDYSTGQVGDPEYLSTFTVRCADPAICLTKVERDPIFQDRGQGLVAGLKEGDTELIIEYTDPLTNQPAQQRVLVRFTAPVVPTPLDVGVKPATSQFGFLLLKDKEGQEYACTGGTTGELWRNRIDVPEETLAAQPADAKAPYDQERRSIYRCEAAREMAPGKTYFCGGVGCTIRIGQANLLACASREGGLHDAPIDGLVLYKKGISRFEIDDARGHPNPGVCLTQAKAP